MKLTTVRVLASKFDETVAFYRDKLKIPVRADAGVYVAFDAGGFELGVYGRDAMAAIVPTLNGSASPTSDHLLINLEVDDLAVTTADLEAAGVTFETQTHAQPDWGMRVVHLRDPEGNLIELYELLPEARRALAEKAAQQ